MRSDTADPHATSHAGQFDGFEVFWRTGGWYVGIPDNCSDCYGPYATSQAAFGAAKDAIDKLIGAK